MLAHRRAGAAAAPRPPTRPPDRDDPAYVMYTSRLDRAAQGRRSSPTAASCGSCADTDYLQLGPDDRVAQASNASFDAITFEIWGALLNGAHGS